MAIMVFQYGLLAPTVEAARVRSQMSLAHKYRNTLTEIERGRRTATRLAMLAYADMNSLQTQVTLADEKVSLLSREVAMYRSKNRARKVPEELSLPLKEAKEVKKIALTAFRERRRALHEDEAVKLQLDKINDRAKILHRSAREYCGVFWGSYLLVEDAMEAASKQPLYEGSEPNDPRFMRWNGEGRVGVQIQQQADEAPCTIERTFSDKDTRLRIDPVNLAAWHSPIRGERRKLSRTVLRMRVGSDGRNPIWAHWPMIMHREVPAGSIIKRATVHLRKIGPTEKWVLDLTVVTPDGYQPRKRGEGVVGIDIGWRIFENEIRVAAWHGKDGDHGELRLNEYTIGGLRKPEQLRSIRDKNFNFSREELVTQIPLLDAPQWFLEATKFLALWRSSSRLSDLVLRWKNNRFDGDEEAYDKAEAWRYHDYHLWQWEGHQRSGSLKHRREVYRIFAAKLAAKYQTLVIEEFDLSKIARRGETSENETARSNRQLCSLSELRGVLINAFGKTNVIVIDAKNTTRECPECHQIDIWDAAEEINHACSKCGLVRDQDKGAAEVILARAEGLESAPAQEPADSPTETRWVRAKRLQEEKIARRRAAKKNEQTSSAQ